jgi:C_GCAxxG_C_C family probable redox protein
LQVLQAYFGLEDGDLWQIATGFGAGFGRRGYVCGAITGGILALGLVSARDRASTREDRIGLRDDVYAKVGELTRRFEEDFGSVQCHDLTGIDFLKEQERHAFDKSDGKHRICFPAIRLVIETAAQLR